MDHTQANCRKEGQEHKHEKGTPHQSRRKDERRKKKVSMHHIIVPSRQIITQAKITVVMKPPTIFRSSNYRVSWSWHC